jgi:hypothetical protein
VSLLPETFEVGLAQLVVRQLVQVLHHQEVSFAAHLRDLWPVYINICISTGNGILQLDVQLLGSGNDLMKD